MSRETFCVLWTLGRTIQYIDPYSSNVLDHLLSNILLFKFKRVGVQGFNPQQIAAIRLHAFTLPSRAPRPLSSPFRCLEVELPLVLWLPSFPLPVPLDKEVEDWLTVLFRLGCSALGVRWRPDMEGEGTGSSFFSTDLLDLGDESPL